MEAWMRALTITLTSTKIKKQMTFGANYVQNRPDLNIDVTVNKYMSSLKDSAVIQIDNLTYNEITQIILGEFYDVDIWCGYRNAAVNKIFSGGVFYISNRLNPDRTHTAIIICTSKMVAKFGKNRLNLTLNSGINLYAAINFICRRAGMTDANISTQLKKQFLDEVMNVNDNVSSWLDKICKTNTNLIPNADSITGQTFSIFDAVKSNSRVIKLTPGNILLTGGYPRLTTDGLKLTLLPTFNFMCGDVVQIDNSIIDISVSTRDEVMKNYASYFSAKGQYMIFEMSYHLCNRNKEFTLALQCKNRDRISAYVGG